MRGRAEQAAWIRPRVSSLAPAAVQIGSQWRLESAKHRLCSHLTKHHESKHLLLPIATLSSTSCRPIISSSCHLPAFVTPPPAPSAPPLLLSPDLPSPPLHASALCQAITCSITCSSPLFSFAFWVRLSHEAPHVSNAAYVSVRLEHAIVRWAAMCTCTWAALGVSYHLSDASMGPPTTGRLSIPGCRLFLGVII